MDAIKEHKEEPPKPKAKKLLVDGAIVLITNERPSFDIYKNK